MSAGLSAALHEPRPDRDMQKLAPKFRAAVEAAIGECISSGYDAMVYETYRSLALQQLYYARGRTVKPPEFKVTNAKSNLYSWHGYGLAVDVISKSELWTPGDAWFRGVAEIFKEHGCDWGGDWQAVDLPHFQWGKCKQSPSSRARKLLAEGGVEAVWKACGAV